MADWGSWTTEQVFGTWAAIATFASLYFGFQTYRLRKQKQLFDLPFIAPSKFQNGSTASLSGNNATSWKIERVRISGPCNALFLEQDAEFDDGGSIVRSKTIEVGREVRSPEYPLYVRSESWPVTLDFAISLRSSPSLKRSLVVSMNE